MKLASLKEAMFVQYPISFYSPLEEGSIEMLLQSRGSGDAVGAHRGTAGCRDT